MEAWRTERIERKRESESREIFTKNNIISELSESWERQRIFREREKLRNSLFKEKLWNSWDWNLAWKKLIDMIEIKRRKNVLTL